MLLRAARLAAALLGLALLPLPGLCAGVEASTPHYALDPRAPKLVPKERWHEPPARPEGKE